MRRDNYNRAFWTLLGFVSICSCGKDDGKKIIDCEKISDKWLIETSSYPSQYKQTDIFFVGDVIGYSAGGFGSIMKTTNGGDSWQLIHEGSFSNKITELKLTSIYFVSDELGYIGGEREDCCFGNELGLGAIFLKTIDGGKNWIKKYFINIQKFNDIIFTDPFHGIALVSENNENNNLVFGLLKTNDGGENWEEVQVTGIRFNSIKFEITNSIIHVLAKDDNNVSVMAISNDHGLNWQTKVLPELECNRIIFINENVGYITCGILFYPERVYKTDNGGDSWILNDMSPINNYSLVHFISVDEGIVINNIYDLINHGGELTQGLNSFEFLETIDGGKNWSKSIVDKTCDFSGAYFSLSSDKFYTMGDKFHRFELK